VNVFDRLHAQIGERNPAPSRAWFVPGRIEVLGKHTDYAGGRSLLCTIDRGFRIVAAPRQDRVITLHDPEQRLQATITLDESLPQTPGHWTNYPRVVARRVARHFPSAHRGADIVFTSDLPTAAGISSSSAFLIAVFLALSAVNDLEQDAVYREVIQTREDLAGFLACVENGYGFGRLPGDYGVGTAGGSEDHTAILCCEANHLAVYSFNPVRHERTIPLDPDVRFVVGSSGIVAEKAGGARDAYNRASISTRQVLEMWNRFTGRRDPSLAAAVASSADAPDCIRGIIRGEGGRDAGYLAGRFDQFVEESETIVPAAAEHLAAGDYGAFGRTVDRSQQLAERLLGNQVPHTIDLARSARRLGALAASAFGGGFGGSVWALVRANKAEAFMENWSSRYRAAYPDCAARSVFFVTGAGPAAQEIQQS
jgi:galactokinase